MKTRNAFWSERQFLTGSRHKVVEEMFTAMKPLSLAKLIYFQNVSSKAAKSTLLHQNGLDMTLEEIRRRFAPYVYGNALMSLRDQEAAIWVGDQVFDLVAMQITKVTTPEHLRALIRQCLSYCVFSVFSSNNP